MALTGLWNPSLLKFQYNGSGIFWQFYLDSYIDCKTHQNEYCACKLELNENYTKKVPMSYLILKIILWENQTLSCLINALHYFVHGVYSNLHFFK